MTSPGRIDRLRGLVWPIACVAGLLLVALAQVKWGVSDEGVRPSITGLGRVSVPGAAAEDVEYFFDGQTRRPGLIVIVAGAVVALAAALGWWRASLRWPAIVVVGLGGAVALGVAVVALSDPAGHLFSERLTEALDLDLPTMQPGYGLIGTLIVGVLVLALAVFWAATSWRRPTRTDESS